MTNLEIIEQLNLFTEQLLKERGLNTDHISTSKEDLQAQLWDELNEKRQLVQQQKEWLTEIFGPKES